MYRFYINAINKSGASSTLTVVAGNVPGADVSGSLTYQTSAYKPSIVDVDETSIALSWKTPAFDSIGGSPVTGYKLYAFEGVARNTVADANPVKQEIQTIAIAGTSLGGTFTVFYNGAETANLAYNAADTDVKAALENLNNVGIVAVTATGSSWEVTFLTEVGNLPAMQVTGGRLTGTNSAITVNTDQQGSAAVLVYDGSDAPNVKEYLVSGLIADALFAFKVSAINAVGDGILTDASLTTATRAGASPLYTTASGSALSSGIAGRVYEEQLLTFCATSGVFSVTDGTTTTSDLFSASAELVQTAVSALKYGDVHVSREAVASTAGVAGFQYSVTFLTYVGDVPMLAAGGRLNF